ncbi:hypothetical protein [Shewanella woodyi]|uniref:hypothetical protein n=1 Tax=Shewanella woodyi TaxID=60961 RepID=UPI003749C8F9
MISQSSNRRDELVSDKGADAAVAVDSMDAVVELTGTYLLRVTEVAAHKSATGDR